MSNVPAPDRQDYQVFRPKPYSAVHLEISRKQRMDDAGGQIVSLLFGIKFEHQQGHFSFAEPNTRIGWIRDVRVCIERWVAGGAKEIRLVWGPVFVVRCRSRRRYAARRFDR